MTTPDDVAVQRAIIEAETTACVLEGMQALREEEVRTPFRARLDSAAACRDKQARRLREAIDKLARQRARTARLLADLANGQPERGAVSALRASWRVALAMMCCASVCVGQSVASILVRAVLPAAAMWLALAVGSRRSR